MSALIRKLYENGLLTAEVTEMELTYLGTAVLDFLPLRVSLAPLLEIAVQQLLKHRG